MFVVKLNFDPSGAHSEYATAYQLIGGKDELRDAHRQITSLALAAIFEGDITAGRAAELLCDIECPSPASIQARNAPAFLSIITQTESLSLDRRDQLLQAGVEGTLGAVAISDEVLLLNCYAGGPFYAGTVDYCNEAGLRMYPTPGTMSIDLDVSSIEQHVTDGFYEPWEEDIISGLPATHASTQFELPVRRYAGVSVPDRAHTSVGNLDEYGTYIPFATILNPSHPARI